MFDLFLLWIYSIVHVHAYLVCDVVMEYKLEKTRVVMLQVLSFSFSHQVGASTFHVAYLGPFLFLLELELKFLLLPILVFLYLLE
jgi:hypothetical protein